MMYFVLCCLFFLIVPVIGGKRYLAVGCGPGVYVGPANSDRRSTFNDTAMQRVDRVQ